MKTNGTIKIDKAAIPIPEAAVGHPRKYPFRELEISQSFFIPGMTTTAGISGSICAARKTGRDYVSRKVDGGVRVWRIK